MTNFAPLSTIEKSKTSVTSLDETIRFTGLALSIVLAIAIYMASKSAGTPLSELASMVAFP